LSSEPIISLKVLTPEGAILEVDQLTSVNVPLIDGGTIGIKPGHAPLIAETIKGFVRFDTETDQKSIELHPGVLDIRDNLVLILTAGEISQTPEKLMQTAGIEFDRLMKTLVRELHPNTENDHPLN
jgi:F0F1-type ATP synthase epsilon subunit